MLPAGTFTDVDAGDSLTYTATAADGSALPAWLSFNAATRTFSGTPAAANVGTLGVKVSATDLGSLAASETFNIVVTTTPVNAPTISNLAVSATSISFVASDPDNATLSLASPFASVFGNPSITSGATTSLNAQRANDSGVRHLASDGWQRHGRCGRSLSRYERKQYGHCAQPNRAQCDVWLRR